MSTLKLNKAQIEAIADELISRRRAADKKAEAAYKREIDDKFEKWLHSPATQAVIGFLDFERMYGTGSMRKQYAEHIGFNPPETTTPSRGDVIRAVILETINATTVDDLLAKLEAKFS